MIMCMIFLNLGSIMSRVLVFALTDNKDAGTI